MDLKNRLKARLLADGPALLGSWLLASSPSTAEALGHCGFDFLVCDMEHVPIDMAELVALLRAVGCTPAEPLVRVAWNDPVLVKRVLDAGARTIMLPFIETPEAAEAAIAATRYPPRGMRGVAGVHRASGYGAATDYLARADEEICVILQLETPAAIARIEEIAAVPGVDALFVGPGDLSGAMGRLGQVGHPEVETLIAEAAARGSAIGKPMGIVGFDPATVGRYLEHGYSFAAIGSDLTLMTGRARKWLGSLKGQAPDKGSGVY
ncbi:2-dehydro-3-deoxyglucarate aldolase [Arsenicitalea aurantiaca]|uniref:2-dehydro-3-deoxyglucarate aldolase n=1 Tax=Arsenicitalea aurantiaca TaxID=1783274 RepID=A0A433X8G4_9HYPH|nr:aldolase/citrate lyase family protein [Arsenicitalea aurantiaca]RUT30387.1 2-dehydro-3-deoxyglucarate aldolase [Arsenicitalea aurantiaca]